MNFSLRKNEQLKFFDKLSKGKFQNDSFFLIVPYEIDYMWFLICWKAKTNNNPILGIDSRFEYGGIDHFTTTKETDVDSVFHVRSGSGLGYRRTTDGGSEYNGLYVPPASESDYGYLSPPTRPPLPYLNGIHRFRGDDSIRDGTSPNVISVYPEDEGHLV